jgi:hypothetical protein
MARPAIFALIAAIGLPLGYFGREALEQPPDRAAAMVQLFETYCLPLAFRNSAPTMDALVKLTGMQIVNQWVDPKSKLMVELTEGHCKVSDSLAFMNNAEREKLDAAIPLAIKSDLPKLKETAVEGMEGWDSFRIWSDASRTFGVSLSRFETTGQDARTELTLIVPKR